jgi:CRP-like cAMP-binding protein
VGLGLYIVVSGRVLIVSSHAALQRVAPECGPGDFFGELALFEKSQRTARAVAGEPTQVLALFRSEFFSLLERDRGIGVKILFELSRTVVGRVRKVLASQPHLPVV